MRNEEETMIVHRLYMVMILELEGVRVKEGRIATSPKCPTYTTRKSLHHQKN